MSLTTLFAGPATDGSSAAAGMGLTSNATASLFARGEVDTDVGISCHGFRIPLIVKTNAGTLLSFVQLMHQAVSDFSCFGIGYKRSTDGGATWSRLYTLYYDTAFDTLVTGVHVNLISAGVDAGTGKVYVIYTRNNSNSTATGNLSSGNTVKGVRIIKSSDDGLTWYKLDGTTLVADSGATKTGTGITVLGTDVSANAMVIGAAPAGHTFGTLSKTLVSATNATPIVVTSTAHGLTNGYKVRISGCNVSGINGDWIVANKTADTFELTGSTAAGAGANAGTIALMWGFVAGYGAACSLANGWLLVPMTHRWTADTSGTSFAHELVCKDCSGDNEVFKLLVTGGRGGLDDTDGAGNPATASADAGSNEHTVVQLTDGSLYASYRIIGQTYRGKATSSDNGVTWSALGSESANGLTGTSTGGGLCYLSNSKVAVQSWPNDPGNANRVQGTLAVSNANAAISTWSTTRIVTSGYFGYSQMVQVASDTLVLVYETGHNVTSQELERISIRRITLPWIQRGTTYNTVDFTFNDDTTYTSDIPGVDLPQNSYGRFFHSHGTDDIRAMAGIATATRSVFSSTAGVGLTCGNAGVGIPCLIADGAMTPVSPTASESMTWEFVLHLNSNFAANEVIFSTCKSGTGVVIYRDSGGHLACQLKSAGFTVNAAGTSTASLANTAIAVVRNAGVVQLYRNGVQDGSNVTDTGFAQTLKNGTDLATSHKSAFFGFYDEDYLVKVPITTGDTLQTASPSAAIREFRMTRRALTAGEMLNINSAPEARTAILPSYRHFTASELPLVTTLPTITNVQFWAFATHNQGYSGRYGLDGEGSYPIPPVKGFGYHTQAELSDNRFAIQALSKFQGHYWMTETLGSNTAFPSYQCYTANDVGGANLRFISTVLNTAGTPTTNLNFMWAAASSGPKFTLMFTMKSAASGATANVFDNINNTAGVGANKAGVCAYINASNQPIMFVVSNDSTTVINTNTNGYTGTVPNVNDGTWYFVAFVSNGGGVGSKLDLWVVPLTGSAVTVSAGTHKFPSVDDIGTNGTTKDAAHDFAIGGKQDDSGNYSFHRRKNLVITNTALTITEIQKWVDLATFY